jgi:hypothetical protein
VEHSLVVAVGGTAEELEKEGLDEEHWELLVVAVDDLFEVGVEVLEDERQLVIRVDDFEEGDDVWVAELLQEGDFADGGGGNTLITGLETNPLESDGDAGASVAGLIWESSEKWRGKGKRRNGEEVRRGRG